MKKTIILMILLIPIFGAFAQNGIIQSLNGTVELKQSGAAAFVPAKTGDTVAQNTVVSTGFKSTAIITVGSATITVRPLTRLSLAEISATQETEQINVYLQSGRVRVDVKPATGSKTSFVVQSPTATASVRGTGFDFDTRNLLVREGTVAFTGANGALMLIPAGSESRVNGENGKAADPLDTASASLTPLPPAGTGSAPSKEPLQPSTTAEFIMDLGF